MTKFGWSTLVVGIVLTVAGWRLVWAPVAILGVGCVLLVLVGLTYLIRRPQLAIERQIQPPRVSKGSLAIAVLDVRNRARSASPPVRAVQVLGAASVTTWLPRLGPRARAVRTARLPTERRGVFDVGPVELRRADPFGFVQLTQRHAGTDRIWVYPQILGFRALPTGLTRPLEGPTSDTAPQGNITFHRLREYVRGDDLRMIHWRSTARTGQLMVKHNIDTSQPYTVVLADLRAEVHSDASFELALDAAASVAACASVGNAPVQLRTSGGDVVGGPNRRMVQPVFDFLTTVEPDGSSSLDAPLVDIRRSGGGTALVVVTGTPSAGDLSQVESMRRQFQRVVIVAITQETVDVPAASGIVVITAADADALVAGWNVAVTR